MLKQMLVIGAAFGAENLENEALLQIPLLERSKVKYRNFYGFRSETLVSSYMGGSVTVITEFVDNQWRQWIGHTRELPADLRAGVDAVRKARQLHTTGVFGLTM